MRSRKLALLAAPLLLLATLPGAASAGGPSATAEAHAAHRSSVLRYWTPQRIRNATPRAFTFDAAKGFQPAAKPGTGGSSGSVTGASYTGGGAALKGTGKVLFTMGGSDYICSGSVVTENKTGLSVVLTAGHCVVENTGEFATNWMFYPAFDTNATYDCATATYGCWVADAPYARKAFATAGSFNNTAVQNDWGFAVVGAGGNANASSSDLIAAVGGSFALDVTSTASGQTLQAFGYPAAGKYHGYDLTYCKGPIGTDPNTSNTTWSMACGMTGGSSGGPWFKSNDVTKFTGTTLNSLNSYGYSGVKNMYGPKFNSSTTETFNDAQNGSLGSNTVRVVFP